MSSTTTTTVTQNEATPELVSNPNELIPSGKVPTKEEQLKELCASTTSAFMLFSALAKLCDNVAVDILAFATVNNIGYGDALRIFRRLEELHVGMMVIGREGTPPSQFIPAYTLSSVGNAGLGVGSLEQPRPTAPTPPITPTTAPLPAAASASPLVTKSKKKPPFDRAAHMIRMRAIRDANRAGVSFAAQMRNALPAAEGEQTAPARKQRAPKKRGVKLGTKRPKHAAFMRKWHREHPKHSTVARSGRKAAPARTRSRKTVEARDVKLLRLIKQMLKAA